MAREKNWKQLQDVDQHIALLDDLVGQAEALVAEDDGRVQVCAGRQLGRNGARRRDGRRLQGKVLLTVVGGRIVHDAR